MSPVTRPEGPPELFSRETIKVILELGGGQGRDTLFFARRGFQTTVLDYSQKGLEDIDKKASGSAFPASPGRFITISKAPSFDDETFDACFSHMLYCMALTTVELEFLSRGDPAGPPAGGLNVYTPGTRETPILEKASIAGRTCTKWADSSSISSTREKVKHLSAGYEILSVNELEEGGLPRKLFMVTMKKNGSGRQ